jgi:formiminoglutamase
MQTLQTATRPGPVTGQHFKYYDKEDVLSLTRIRRFETKLGERINVIHDKHHLEQSLQHSTAKYVLFGVPEDIGVKANYGLGGTDSAWVPFLSSFLNIQSNDFAGGEEVLLLGHFDFGDIKYLIEQNAHGQEERIDAYRHAVNTIDEEVENLVKHITASGRIPIVIGGGHNNAYPLIKGAAKGLYKAGAIPLAQINAINLDAHTDFRPSEGRHSGNGFRYAEEDGYLLKYCVVGVHLNCVEGILASAATPAGISPLQARQFVNFAGVDSKPAYLHICEGAVQLHDGRKDENTGKLISYLVSDFIKANSYGKE